MGFKPVLPLDFVGEEITDIRSLRENYLRFLYQF
jgi:hypothetical protein